MGFLTPEPIDAPHECSKPGPPSAYDLGTRWQCDDCGTVYRVEPYHARGAGGRKWAKRPLRAADVLDSPLPAAG